MTVRIKVATILLSKADPPLEKTTASVEIPEGADARSLIEALGIPESLVGTVTVNKRRRPLETALAEGDAVAIIPSISGG